MTRRRKRLIAALVGLAVLLALLGACYLNYSATRKLGLDLNFGRGGSNVVPPEYLFSFSGVDSVRLTRPIGLLIDGDDVWVAESRDSVLMRFGTDGKPRGIFGKGKLQTPLYVAQNPTTGDIYVSDRGLKKIAIFKRDGSFVRFFDPKLPKKVVNPQAVEAGLVWSPVALTFAPDGTMYVTDTSLGHRIMMFAPSGKFTKTFGRSGVVERATEEPGALQFPNDLIVRGGELWVADSNNRRVQVFDLQGNFLRLVSVGGLPRGLTFLNSKVTTSAKDEFAVVDTLAHDVTLWSAKGQQLVAFGGQGILEGQFSYPTDIVPDSRGRLFITDTANGRVQVWGWPERSNPVPMPRTPSQWAWCFSPLLLLVPLLLRRKKRYVATLDFVEAMVTAGYADLMRRNRVRWVMEPEQHERMMADESLSSTVGDLIESFEYSDSDARALMDKLELDHPSAVALSIARRAALFATEDPELRRLARLLEIETVNRTEYVERFGGGPTSGNSSGAGGIDG